MHYERASPGEPVYIDIRKLGRIGEPGRRVTGRRTHRCRGIGWEYAHVSIDDHPRRSLVAMAEDERQGGAVAFLEQVVAHYRACGVAVQRVMTANGSADQSNAFAAACRRLGIRHSRTRPYTPQTNGKAGGWSRPACANGPMRVPMPTPSNVPAPSAAGCTTTTGIGPTPASATNHQSPASR